MALIEKAQFNQKEKLKIEINSEILKKIHLYCQWSNIDTSYFIEEAACYVFSKDKDFKSYIKHLKKTDAETA